MTSHNAGRDNPRWTHGKTKSKEYKIWESMLSRCRNKKYSEYEYYGARGITVCKRWESFVNFFEDMGSKPSPDLTLERQDNDKGYSPGNCTWATRTAQARNTRTQKNNSTGYAGVSKSKNGLKFTARIYASSQCKHLGTYPTIEEATEARRQGEIKYWGTDD